ncbi:MAG: metallophosphoesterase [Hyphococcus sp.]
MIVSRRWLSTVLVAAAALILFTRCATADETEEPSRIIAIGDLHGDYEAFHSILTRAGLIDKRNRWSGGKTILVQTGDIADRGPDSRKIIELVKKLQKRAPRDGGQVVTLVGNHEAMNMTGDLRYVHPGEYAAFIKSNSRRVREAAYDSNRDAIEAYYLSRDPGLASNGIRDKWFEETPLGKLEHQAAWRPDGEIGEWVAGNPAVARVGDTLFVHGGISETYASYALEEINDMVSTALAAPSSSGQSVLNDPLGPLWYRGHVRSMPLAETEAAPDDAATDKPAPGLSREAEIDLVLSRFSVDRIVIGHTPSLTGVKALDDGKVIQIDTGIAAHYGGTQSYLEIKDGVVIAHDDDESRTISGVTP